MTLSDQAVLCLSLLLEARDAAQEAHTEALEWRELGAFSLPLLVRLEFHKHLEAKPDPEGGEFKVYRITQRGVETLKAQQTELERPKGKRGRRAKAEAAETPSSDLRSKIRRFGDNGSQKPAREPESPTSVTVLAQTENPSAVAQAQKANADWIRENASQPLSHAAGPDYVPPQHTPLPLVSDEQLAVGCICRNCVYKQAVEIIGAKVPALLGLVEALIAIEAIGE